MWGLGWYDQFADGDFHYGVRIEIKEGGEFAAGMPNSILKQLGDYQFVSSWKGGVRYDCGDLTVRFLGRFDDIVGGAEPAGDQLDTNIRRMIVSDGKVEFEISHVDVALKRALKIDGVGDFVSVWDDGSYVYKGASGNDVIKAFNAWEPARIEGLGGNDTLISGWLSVKSHLLGGNGDDTLSAAGNRCMLTGGKGNDLLIGSWHATMKGGAGEDTFRPDYAANETYIVDFRKNDVLDVRTIESHDYSYNTGADALEFVSDRGNNKKFDFIGESAFSGADMELRSVRDWSDRFGEVTMVYAVIDASTRREDLVFILQGFHKLEASDFAL